MPTPRRLRRVRLGLVGLGGLAGLEVLVGLAGLAWLGVGLAELVGLDVILITVGGAAPLRPRLPSRRRALASLVAVGEFSSSVLHVTGTEIAEKIDRMMEATMTKIQAMTKQDVIDAVSGVDNDYDLPEGWDEDTLPVAFAAVFGRQPDHKDY